jgi:hypothetical protein
MPKNKGLEPFYVSTKKRESAPRRLASPRGGAVRRDLPLTADDRHDGHRNSAKEALYITLVLKPLGSLITR